MDDEAIEIVIDDLSPARKTGESPPSAVEPLVCRDSVNSLLTSASDNRSRGRTPVVNDVSSKPDSVRNLRRIQSVPTPQSAPVLEQSPPVAPRPVSVLASAASVIGRKPTQEDTYLLTSQNLSSALQAEVLVAVFDGHNGKFASQYLRDHLPEALEASGQHEALAAALGRCEGGLYEAYVQNPQDSAGSTALVALVCCDGIHFANVGDSRAIMSRNGIAKVLTRDQKPTCEIERERILTSGAFLDSEGYINGDIGVARALGNFHLSDIKKPPNCELPGALISTPEVHVEPYGADDEFVVLASDGLWDVMSNQRVVQIVREQLMKSEDCETAAKALVNEAEVLETRDNTTVVVVSLKPLPLVMTKKTQPKSRNKNSRLFRRTSSAPSESIPKPTEN
eukprot:g3845.t1